MCFIISERCGKIDKVVIVKKDIVIMTSSVIFFDIPFFWTWSGFCVLWKLGELSWFIVLSVRSDSDWGSLFVTWLYTTFWRNRFGGWMRYDGIQTLVLQNYEHLNYLCPLQGWWIESFGLVRFLWYSRYASLKLRAGSTSFNPKTRW